MNDRDVRVGAIGWLEKDEELWAALNDRNGLCRICKKNGQVDIAATYQSHNLSAKDQFYLILSAGKRIVTLPKNAQVIGVYDEVLGSLQEVEIKNPKAFVQGEFYSSDKFMGGLVHGNYVYMFGLMYPAILVMDVDTLQIKYMTDWIDSEMLQTGRKTGFLAQGCVRIGTDVYVAVRKQNIILKLDLTTNFIQKIFIDCSAKGFDFLISCNHGLGIASWGGDKLLFILWNPENGRIREFEIAANIDIKESRKYLIPFLEGEAYVVDLDTGNAKICIKLNQLIHEREGGRYLVQSVRTMSDRLVIQTGSDCYIHEYDPLTEKIDSYCYEIRDEVYIKQYYEEATADKVREAEDMSRIFFLDKLQWISEYFVQKDDQGKSIGKDVYQVIKEMGNI